MFSRLLRRTHMYLALFLFPWILMYALSTLAMNHRAFFAARYGPAPVPFVTERELTYEGVLPEGPELKPISAQILASVGLDGAHGVSPRRITYTPETRNLVIERMTYRSNAFLERFHRRRGYETGYRLDTVWAVSVDLVIVAMIFWVASGLWMWWEMKLTRPLGAMALAGGAGLFALFLATL
jgi:hypothetical protein